MHIQVVLKKDGANKMYVCPDAVTGIPFWTAMGFKNSEKTDPDDKKPIYIKKIAEQQPCAKMITIRISKYLTNPLAGKIAMMQWHSGAPEFVDHLRNVIYNDSYFYDCFDVIAADQKDNVIGRLHCIQNETDKSLWYYGDLSVIPEYRRMGIATQMIQAAIKHLIELGAKTLRTYVDPDNASSIALQKSIGFAEKPYQIFNELFSDGQIMFEFTLPSPYSVIPAGPDEAIFVLMFYQENIETLHGKPIPLGDWKEILSSEDEDERHFLICRGCMPVAWLRLSGLLQKDMAQISMLAVSDKHHRQGVGLYAIEFAEEFIKQKGIQKIGARTTEDNIPAQNLFRKCGYAAAKQEKLTFVKELKNG